MDRRLGFEQRMLFEIVEGFQMRRCLGPAEFLARHHMENLAPEAPVAQQSADIFMAREAPIAIVLPFEDRYSLAQPPIDGMGIVEELYFTRVEADASMGGVDLHVRLV